MKILAKLTGNSKTITKDIYFYGSMEEAKEKLYHVEYEGSYYEWVMYDLGKGYYDIESQYCQVKGRPISDRIYSISDQPWGGNVLKCECGAASLGHPGHSYWCSKFKR